MKVKSKQFLLSLIYLLVAILILVTLNRFVPYREPVSISYSEFKILLREGLVNEVEISNDKIDGNLLPGAYNRILALRNEKDDAKARKLRETKAFSTARIQDPDLVKELDQKGTRYTAMRESPWIGTLVSWGATMFLFLLFWAFILRRMGGAGQGLMAVGKSKAKIYVEGETKVTFVDVAGVDEAEGELQEVIEFLRDPKRFQSLGGKIPKGILLVGPPGTGKTLLAKAVAGEAKVAFLSLSGSAFVEMFVGVGAARVRDLFDEAEKHAPAIIFIDEIDALGKARGVSPMSGIDEREQTLTQLLSEMDGFDTRKGVIIMAATNRPEILDAALLRAGRFDRHILVDRPDLKGREDIFRVHTKKVILAPEIDLKVLASMTPGMVGADIANIVNEAALLAARKDKKAIDMGDFEEAVERTVAGLEKKSRVINKKEKEIVSYHESGHAIVASRLPHADPVRRVSIIPRGIAALGYTIQLPTEDRYLLTKGELLDKITVMLGGRAAEEVIFGEPSTGARDDLAKATEIAINMVKTYGMSDELGLLALERNRALFLGVPGYEKDYSEETAGKIDAEVKRILTEAYEKAKYILMEDTEKLRNISSILREKEMIEGDELRNLLQGTKRSGT
ncbi:membrane protease FtsH catalytic subunit [Syntrophus gentianae]|uniref:ATP-dependent zinc metalloprotease FtsH n=1 Tax=Syntrophus gentianae TaxID=43775 RepID=A0A1H7XW48_9BACT|nr:ATP-dependent zinc metalloprotease FtsH [Syntrophus gentianae]SEM37378.1 membrane protease FtsH catalytic subunit [Syntrophus gentianae]